MTDAAYQSLMLDYATGASTEAEALLVETHVRMSAMGRAALRAAEALGGALLETARPAPMRTGFAAPALLASRGALSASPGERRFGAAHALVWKAAEGGAGLDWRWRPALRETWLPVEGATLLKIPAGSMMPVHGHDGPEVTLVLKGAFEDENGVYQRGEIAFADEHVEHAPRVVGREDCICLAATQGGLQFRCSVTRLASWLLK